jgi:signal transduction histidine kinase
MVLVLLAVRAVHVAQGVICVLNGWSSYRRPRLAGLALALCAAESAWLTKRCWRADHLEPLVTRVELATGMTGLLIMAAATHPDDRTTSMNWMLPYTVGATAGFSIAEIDAERFGGVGVLSATYLATAVAGAESRSASTTAIANAASYPGFFAVAESVVRILRRTFRALDQARRQSAERGEQLSVARQQAAVEQERNRQFRLIHDSALQTLEVVAADLHADPERVRAQAKVESARLRRALTGTGDGTGDLAQGLAELAEEADALGLVCSWTSSAEASPPAPATEALLHAAREAIRNVMKHAETAAVVVRAVDLAEGVQVTVRDQGVGFDPEAVVDGFGLRQSVAARVAEVGGTAEIWSRPGRGVRVTLWVPT